MSQPAVIEAALKRLSSALDLLDAAVQRRTKADAARSDLVEELAIMQDDRSRLAVDLDGAMGRIRRLELAYAEAERRLERVDTTIRAVLGDDDIPGPDDAGKQEE